MSIDRNNLPINPMNEKDEKDVAESIPLQVSATEVKVNYSQLNYQYPHPTPKKEEGSFVKLAMRNMVKKGGKSLFHFFLTVFGVFGTLVGLAIAFH
jgi:hypothetical protein